MQNYDIVIIGGGPAGLAAALSARNSGAERILILERDRELGGILNQCIHNGFGLHTFKEELTGPEYAARFIEQLQDTGIEYKLNTMVLELSSDRTVTAVNSAEGILTYHAKAVILAMGCRERARGALNIPGYRPAGIFSAGTAQRLVNVEGYLPGKEVVILGSGDIGLIMARRLTLEGAKVKVVAELLPYSGGLKRNIVQCLDDFGIPLKLSHTVTNIHGKKRVEGVTLAQVDENRRPIPGTEEYYSCDTLLLSCGLIPENEISLTAGININPVTSGPFVNERFETNVSGIFACGNVLHVHDLVDFVSQEAALAGKYAAQYAARMVAEADTDLSEADGAYANLPEANETHADRPEADEAQADRPEAAANGGSLPVMAGYGVRYAIPSTIAPEQMEESLIIRFRVTDVFKDCYTAVYLDGERVIRKKRRVAAPGEMEEIVLKKELFSAREETGSITVKIEEA